MTPTTTKVYFELVWASLGESAIFVAVNRTLTIDSDLGEAFPDGPLVELLRQEYITRLIREARQPRDFSERTRDAARWARQVVKVQTTKHSGNIMNPS